MYCIPTDTAAKDPPGAACRPAPVKDTLPDTLQYPLQDRHGVRLAEPGLPAIDLEDPALIRQTVDYDPVTRQYTITEHIGNQYYRHPTLMSFQDFYRLRSRESEQRYFQQRAATLGTLNRQRSGPALFRGNSLFDRLFGGNKLDIKPQGDVSVSLAYSGQYINNPALAEQARRNGGFDMDMSINLNVTGKIGDKLKITTAYNTQSTFDFENQVKLEYTGYDDEILKKIEVGNVSFPLGSSLISGMQSLFGVKTQLQFGRLRVTSVLSSQKSEKQTQAITGGAVTQQYSIKAYDYEDNRHFLLAQFFRDTFNYAMGNLPTVRSLSYVTRIEVWVTNKTGATTNTRNVACLADLAEYSPYNKDAVHVLAGGRLPYNNLNDLYGRLASDGASRNPGAVVSQLQAIGLKPVQDFEKTYARKLDSTEYTVNRHLGYISVNAQLSPDQVLAVAYEYSYNGTTYKVGEFAQDVPPDPVNNANSRILFLKLLKATAAQPALPVWDLMMKNIYSIGAYQLSSADFTMDVYYNDPGSDTRAAGLKRYLPDAAGSYAGKPLISILHLDNLNSNNDPQPDGRFDFVNGYTINAATGHIIFPLLEPFGKDLQQAFGGNAALEKKYLYPQLYDSTKTAAEQYASLNRYLLKGSYKAGSSQEISLGAFNIPVGSVTVTAGGKTLVENVDYTVDYNLGRIKIINAGILNAGSVINVSYEDSNLYGQQVRNYLGTRLDYTVNDRLTLGSTVVHMSERPYTNKVNYGEDPISNTMVGLDGTYNAEWKGLTRLLDKLPAYSTKAPSQVSASGEVVRLFPGHSKLINAFGTDEGLVYIDDFEGTESSYDLKIPATGWHLASTPAGATDAAGAMLFPEAALHDSLGYGKNRALLAWYVIEPTLQVPGASGLPANITVDEQSDPRVRLVYQQEIFPNTTTDYGQSQLTTLDLAYYPDQRGPYNFETDRSEVNTEGALKNPARRWGGIMRSLDNTDFETANVQYIECWLQDPFIKDPGSKGGYLYFNLGNVSEDVLKDSRKAFENGMNNPAAGSYDSTAWGRTPSSEQQLTQAFDNDAAVRQYQDIGYDGLSTGSETAYRSYYLQQLRSNFGSGSAAYRQALADPSNDDYHYYRGSDYDAQQLSILARYKRYSMPENNSPVASGNSAYSTAATNVPDAEDLNFDNTMNETEAYYQYRIHLTPDMAAGTNYIVDKVSTTVTLANGGTGTETWYQLKIPVDQYDAAIGGITGFRSIRFMRMFLTGFEDSVVLRFGKLQLVRNQWRPYAYELQAGSGDPVTTDDATAFSTTVVNIEENASRQPVAYALPPGLQRQSTLSSNNTSLLMNEQSLSLQICQLQDGRARAVYKTLGMDLRRYQQLQMFIHAEAVNDATTLKDGDLQAVIRIGSDYTENFYEYRIPLKVTAFGATNPAEVWPSVNELDLALTDLTGIKQARNSAGASTTALYEKTLENGHTIAVIGNPSLGDVAGIMMGVLNPANDGMARCTEVWFNELRLTGLDEKGGYAASGQVHIQLADLGTLALSGNMHTAGFGTVDQSVNERYQDNLVQYDASLSLDLGKLLPQQAGITVPLYAGYSRSSSMPEYDPFDLDIPLKEKLARAPAEQRDSIKRQAQDFTAITSINVTNLRKISRGHKKLKPWSIENFDLTYTYSGTRQHNPLTENYALTKHRGILGYNYSTETKFREPFKKLFKSRSKWLDLVRDFNYNLLPDNVSFRADIARQFSATRLRNTGSSKQLEETVSKYFTFDRYYALKWDLTRHLSFDFSAVNNARIDEPEGRLDTRAAKDSVWQNLLQLGRTTAYSQVFNGTYTLPLGRFPLLSWIHATVNYAAQYRWTAGSLANREQGNTISNTQQIMYTSEWKLADLYNRSKLLRQLSSGRQADSGHSISPLLRGIIKPLLAVKKISIHYSENSYTTLPGYMDSTRMLGMNWRSMQPGLAFVLGYQPDRQWLDNLAQKGLITRDTLFNTRFQQQFTQTLNIQALLEPATGMQIDISLTKAFSKDRSELFKDRYGGGQFEHLDPYETGGFEASYIMLKTWFSDRSFDNFQQYRSVFSQRYWESNPYAQDASLPIYDTSDAAYRYGYSRYQQNVLISSFLAAYTGQHPGKARLLSESAADNIRHNPFSSILPMPNWRITYNGLSKLEPFSRYLQTLTLSHAYIGSLSMNAYNSAAGYKDENAWGYPGFIDSLSGNYIPYYTVPNITLVEQLAPLLGIDATFRNNLGIRLGFASSRSLSLSLTDYQLTETRGSEITAGCSYRIKGLTLPFAINRQGARKLNNDLNFRLDLSYRDDKTENRQLDGNADVITGGQKTIGVSTTVDCMITNRVNLQCYYTRNQQIPALSTASPTVATTGGLKLRFILGQ
ncbi:T9SS outer membrane translocon Sov/SprA [Chitinophaga japonensis]|nr:cell surface protein SprA [Chitinophaga japonensis]